MLMAEWLPELRKRLGESSPARRAWSQHDLARKLRVLDTTVARWEQGERYPAPRYERTLKHLGRDAKMPPMPERTVPMGGNAAWRAAQKAK
jgi:transcriptional regulator with XRE-family HTH domain